MHETAQNYVDNINVTDLQKLEKLHIKQNKAQFDINFLINCKNFCVFPKFINIYLPNVDEFVWTRFVWNKEKTSKQCNT